MDRIKVGVSVNNNSSGACELMDKYPYQLHSDYLIAGGFFMGRHFNATPAPQYTHQNASSSSSSSTAATYRSLDDMRQDESIVEAPPGVTARQLL